MEKCLLLFVFIFLVSAAVSAGSAVQVSAGRSGCYGMFDFLSCSSKVLADYSFFKIGFPSVFVRGRAGHICEKENITPFTTVSGSKFFSLGIGKTVEKKRLCFAADAGMEFFFIADDCKNCHAAFYIMLEPSLRLYETDSFSVSLNIPVDLCKSGSVFLYGAGLGLSCQFAGC